MNHLAQHAPRKTTARSRIASVLTQEILTNSHPVDFPIESEHQLCRRFGVSRVTIRLALADLEHRRLIYRRHGKGTFAHARSTRVHPNIGISLQSPDALKCGRLVDFIRGAQTTMTSLNSSVVLISTSQAEWRVETTSSLGSVIFMQEGLTAEQKHNLKKRSLAFFCIPDTQLACTDIDCYQLGLSVAKLLDDAVLAGEIIDEYAWETLR